MDIERINNVLLNKQFENWVCTGIFDTGIRTFAMIINYNNGNYLDVTITDDSDIYLSTLIDDISNSLISMNILEEIDSLIGEVI